MNQIRQITLGTAAWNAKSLIGDICEFVAVIEIDTMLFGLPATFSKSNLTSRPFFANAVIWGIPECKNREGEIFYKKKVNNLIQRFINSPVLYLPQLYAQNVVYSCAFKYTNSALSWLISHKVFSSL